MSISWNFPIRRFESQIRLSIDLKLRTTGSYLAWWYSGFKKNTKDESQTLVLVTFRKISNGKITDEFAFSEVPISAVGQVRIGTIWSNNICESEYEFSKFASFVNFSQDGWEFASFAKSSTENKPPPFPRDIYPLKRVWDKNPLIEFRLENGGRLLVPCIEFFSRCFGRSAEVKRILAAYRWDGPGETATSKLYANLDTPETDDSWQVRLKMRLHNSDVVFLAHAKYDRYTQKVARKINADLEAGYSPDNKDLAFIEIPPWFEGMAALRVEGIPFDGGKSFLALTITGMSDPGGVIIHRSRENAGKAETPAPDGSPESWAGAIARVDNYKDIVDLTSELAPDHGAPSIEVHDKEFVILGLEREVLDVKSAQAKSKAAARRIPPMPSTISAGERYGSRKDVGYAEVFASPKLEIKGMLYDMWDALLDLQKSQPRQFLGVEWFTFLEGFCSTSIPRLIALKPFRANETATAAARLFAFMDSTKTKARAILVARVTLPTGFIYIVEIARRKIGTSREDGGTSALEQSFQGLMFILNEDSEFQPWLENLLDQIRHKKGVFRGLANTCPGRAISFSHQVAKPGQTGSDLCKLTILGAISRLDG